MRSFFGILIWQQQITGKLIYLYGTEHKFNRSIIWKQLKNFGPVTLPNQFFRQMEETKYYIEITARIIEIIGVLTIAVGAALALLKFMLPVAKDQHRSYKVLRQNLGKAILLGLEILVAADIIATVVTEPTMERVLTLGLIVLIRTFLSLSLQVELEGKFPWQTKQKEQEVV